MNTAEARESLDAAAENVVSFGLRNNFNHSGPFFLWAHELDQKAVDAAQAEERRQHPGLPLVASAGMKPGTHVALIEIGKTGVKDRTVWMSTHELEKVSQAEFVANARGRVLIAGFGLGLVTEAVLAKPEVTEVVVIEKNVTVLDVMADRILGLETWVRPASGRSRRRLRIVEADVFKWKPRGRFDTVFFDIWPHITPKNIPGMIGLRRRYRPRLNPGGWMGCWAEAECREALRRLEASMPNAGNALKMIDDVYGQDGVVLTMCRIDEGEL